MFDCKQELDIQTDYKRYKDLNEKLTVNRNFIEEPLLAYLPQILKWHSARLISDNFYQRILL